MWPAEVVMVLGEVVVRAMCVRGAKRRRVSYCMGSTAGVSGWRTTAVVMLVVLMVVILMLIVL